MSKSSLFALVCFLSFFGCTESFFYQASIKPENSIWTYNDPLVFDFNIEDTTARYDFFLDVKHRMDYPFQNLYTKIITEHPLSAPQEDIVSLELANQLGLWQGKCAKESCKVRIQLQENARFNEIGDYALQFNQFTRTDTLKGVSELALRIQKKN